jgi:Fic family protein
MIFSLPTPEPVDLKVLNLISEQHQRLGSLLASEPRAWMGSLRRSSMARAIQGSNTIEGYHATLDQAVAVVANEQPLDYSETYFATKGYRDAMTYILTASRDPDLEFNKQLLKSLHFMMVGHEPNKQPGSWRSVSVYVSNSQTGETVYEAPDAARINDLVEELVVELRVAQDRLWAPLLGAMAHLNLTMIHPFRDGNGRMARALQTLVIARAGMRDPVLCSIEEWLGSNTQAYYQVLAEVGQGKWNPGNNALPWIRFCLRAHFQQAQRIIRRSEEYSKIYTMVRTIIEKYKFEMRSEMALFDACVGLAISNSRYRLDAEVNDYTAARDLKKLVELGLLEPEGEGRGRRYRAGNELRAVREQTRSPRRLDDPYTLADQQTLLDARRAESDQLTLPLTPSQP